jgi:hypothetical protein
LFLLLLLLALPLASLLLLQALSSLHGRVEAVAPLVTQHVSIHILSLAAVSVIAIVAVFRFLT